MQTSEILYSVTSVVILPTQILWWIVQTINWMRVVHIKYLCSIKFEAWQQFSVWNLTFLRKSIFRAGRYWLWLFSNLLQKQWIWLRLLHWIYWSKNFLGISSMEYKMFDPYKAFYKLFIKLALFKFICRFHISFKHSKRYFMYWKMCKKVVLFWKQKPY